MPYEEIRHIDRRIEEMKKRQGELPAVFLETKAEIDGAIGELLKKAGSLGRVRHMERQLEEAKIRIQREADRISGRLDELRALRERLEKVAAEIEAEEAGEDESEEDPYVGPAFMYGIDLTALDPETRLMVMSGNKETIEVLGGTPPPDARTILPPADASSATSAAGHDAASPPKGR